MENTNKTALTTVYEDSDMVVIPRHEYDDLKYKEFVYDFVRNEKIRNLKTGGVKYITSDSINLYKLAAEVEKAREAESEVE